jgi:hypothetical protein
VDFGDCCCCCCGGKPTTLPREALYLRPMVLQKSLKTENVTFPFVEGMSMNVVNHVSVSSYCGGVSKGAKRRSDREWAMERSGGSDVMGADASERTGVVGVIVYGTKIFRRRTLGQYIVWQGDLRYTAVGGAFTVCARRCTCTTHRCPPHPATRLTDEARIDSREMQYNLTKGCSSGARASIARTRVGSLTATSSSRWKRGRGEDKGRQRDKRANRGEWCSE